MTHQKDGRYVMHDFICWKLFNFFAYPATIDAEEIAELSAVFLNRNSIRDVLQRLFLSTAFQSNRCYRALIKSPVELAIGALRTLGASLVPWNTINIPLQEQGQRLFLPRNVSGWPSGRAWINDRTLLSRWNMCAAIVNIFGHPGETGGVPVAQLLAGLPTSAQKVDGVLGLLVDNDVPPTTRQALIGYTDGATTDLQIRGLFNLVLALPQFQLN
jgi:hypothetical protein